MLQALGVLPTAICVYVDSLWFVPPRLREGVAAVQHWAKQVELETALEQQKRLTELVDARQLVVKTAALEEAIDEWPSSMLRRIQSAHSAIILASEGGLSLSRATSMPLSWAKARLLRANFREPSSTHSGEYG
jgi:hypothetical protein